ncbi:YopX family protein [Leuconostoc pseudomesenteroides]|uniref:YopX family protein n=1 Tax=Leuconostoc pseudomesenteroides TaxID=33968 RepID=UPI00166C3026|nr:YopX family protein [Leuconostoc pseudomesenteroides]
MREIKFRVWYSDRKSSFYIYGSQALRLMGYFGQEGYSFEQYTGLNDKNGVEIYENDILKSAGGNIEVVIYIDGRFEPVCWYDEETYEVIGNVHQNYDLLAEDIERMIPDDIGNDIHEFLHGGDK